MSLAPALGIDDDARQLRLVRRRGAGASARGTAPTSPGVIMFEIDGLAEPVLRRALERGPRADDGALAGGRQPPDRPVGVRPLLADRREPGGAAARQQLRHAGLPLVREGERARRWCPTTARTRPRSSARHSDGGGLLAAGGASRGNLFSGDAPRCSATMSVLRDRERSSAQRVLRLLRRSVRASRARSRSPCGTCCSSCGRRAASASAARSTSTAAASTRSMRGVDHGRDARPQRRHACSATSSRACRSSTRRSSATTRSRTIPGIEEPDAFAVLAQHDAQLARLERAIEQAPRPYHLVVLSDHGQTQGRPFRQRYGIDPRGAGARRAQRRRGLRAARRPDEGMSYLGGALTDARDEDDAAAPGCSPGRPATASSTARLSSGRTGDAVQELASRTRPTPRRRSSSRRAASG